MKKILVFVLIVFVVAACGESGNTGSRQSARKENPDGPLWLVESKSPPIYYVGYTLELSNLQSRRMRSIEVGKFTYDHTEPGDTIKL